MDFLKEPIPFPYMHYKWLFKSKHFKIGLLKKGERYGKKHLYGIAKHTNRLSVLFVLYLNRFLLEYEYFRKNAVTSSGTLSEKYDLENKSYEN